jgi:copper chaperone
MSTLNLTIPSMACGACADTITKAVQSVDRDATVTADTQTKVVQIETTAEIATIKSAIAEAGYPVD